MNTRANSDPIPMDLMFRCLSKPWKSIICGQDFIDLFRTMSSSNPRLIIGVQQVKCGRRKPSILDPRHTVSKFRFYSSPQPQNHNEKSSLVVAEDFDTKLVGDCQYDLSYASGLFYFSKTVYEDEDDDAMRVICNPSTGQYAILPPVDLYRRRSSGFLGFDPIGKQFKVLVCRVINETNVYHILTVGTEKMRWREIKCPSIYGPGDVSSGICINGVLYYRIDSYIASGTIGYFDVRSEKFKFLHADPDVLNCFQELINYKGKLCGSNLKSSNDGVFGFPLNLRMWVLEDVEKGEWSTYAYTLNAGDKDVKVYRNISVVGVTASGEIVLVNEMVVKPFYVFYFNPETNTLRSVEIQGVRDEEEFDHYVYCFVDHVVDLNFDFMKTSYAATTSTKLMRSCKERRNEDREI